MISSVNPSSVIFVLLAILKLLVFEASGDCDGVCVPLNECADDEHHGGVNWFDIRVGNDNEVESDCPDYLRVCCKNVKSAVQNPQQPDIFNINEGSTSAPNQVAKEHMMFNDCGIRNVDGAGFRITHASDGETEFGEFPWMVALFADTSYICGGSLIRPNVVVTAGHCVFSRKNANLVARVGEWDSKTTDEVRPFQEQRVSRVIMHEQYNPKFLFNNIALLILEEPIQPDDHIQLLCLPAQGQSFDNQEDCIATGWGKERFDSPSYQTILKKVELPVVAHDDCQKAFRKTRLGATFKLHESMTCAGGQEGVDTCTGDGGSPLVCPNPNNGNRYELAGIVAWGIGCGQIGIPGAYVRSSLYTDWIEQIVDSSSGDVDY